MIFLKLPDIEIRLRDFVGYLCKILTTPNISSSCSYYSCELLISLFIINRKLTNDHKELAYYDIESKKILTRRRNKYILTRKIATINFEIIFQNIKLLAYESQSKGSIFKYFGLIDKVFKYELYKAATVV
jgi:hypothetical protein